MSQKQVNYPISNTLGSKNYGGLKILKFRSSNLRVSCDQLGNSFPSIPVSIAS